MKAAVQTNYGGPGVVSIQEIAQPSVGPQEVLVRVHSSVVTQGDRRLRSADFPGLVGVLGRLAMGWFRPRFSVGGSNFAGQVVAVGAKVQNFRPGDDVFGATLSGCYAEYLTISSQAVIARMPAALDYDHAAALPYGAITALTFLRDFAKLKQGQRLLIVGAGGGVGRLAVQVGKSLGAHVTAAVRRESESLKDLGADEILNVTRSPLAQQSDTWDVIFDTTEGTSLSDYRAQLSAKGQFLSLYVTVKIVLQMAYLWVLGAQRARSGVAMGSGESLSEVAQLAQSSRLRDPIAARYPLVEIAQAHHHLESKKEDGAIVIQIAS